MSINIFDSLESRGLIVDVTKPELRNRLEKPITVYIGFDPTAESLHVGSLAQIITLLRFVERGHRAFALVGGGTGLIGDPSFKATERALLDEHTVRGNSLLIKKQLNSIGVKSGLDFEIVDNESWYSQMNMLTFLRDVGKNFSVNAMLRRDAVSNRLNNREQGISFTEFAYPLLQAYDFATLNRIHNCELQIGGSDQWGNILDGVELCRRMNNTEVFGLTTPLITKADGSKFGKTEAGNIWLDPKLTTPHDFYQFWFNTADSDVIKFLKIYSFLSLKTINELEESTKINPEQRLAQKALAEELTILVHGRKELDRVLLANEVLFSKSVSLTEENLRKLFVGLAVRKVPRKFIGSKLVDIQSVASVCESNSEFRRLVKNNAIEANNKKIHSPDEKIVTSDLIGNLLLIKTGKKSFTLLEFLDE